MRFGRQIVLFLVALAALLAFGCGSNSVPDTPEDQGKPYDAMVKQFGELVMKGDWASAYAMTTPAFQATTSQADLQKEYDDLIAQIKQDDPKFNPNMVEVDHGDLPSNEAEAKDDYGLKTVPPKSTWKAWMFSKIGDGNPTDGMDRGVEAMVLVVDDGGQPKFAHVEFGFQS